MRVVQKIVELVRHDYCQKKRRLQLIEIMVTVVILMSPAGTAGLQARH